MRVTSFGITHPGCQREKNEDGLLLLPNNQFYAVADGLGGLPDGDVASKLALDFLAQRLGDQPSSGNPEVRSLFEEANAYVHAEGKERHSTSGIGTTLTAASIHDDRLITGHVGDSSIHLLREGRLHLLTEEHTMAAELGASHANKNNASIPEFYYHTLTRCIGAAAKVEISVEEFQLQDGDRFLLSTDGLIKVVPEEMIKKFMDSAKNAQQLVEILLELALENGCPDNITLIALFVSAEEA